MKGNTAGSSQMGFSLPFNHPALYGTQGVTSSGNATGP
jgi:hypothetical protein